MRSNKLVQAVDLLKYRRARRAKSKKTIFQWLLGSFFIAIGLISVVLAMLALAALPLYLYLTANLPSAARFAELLDPQSGELLNPTHLYDGSGEELLLTLAPAGIDRKMVSAADVPWLAKAYVASNQPDFWEEKDLAWRDWCAAPITIAETLAARLLLTSEPDGWQRNVRARLLAVDALARNGKEQILTWALNSIDFGHWAFGAESAAQLYFGKPASELTLAESALLAAVAQAPALNPIDAPELAIRFQQLVLTAMRDQNLITEEELNSALAQQLDFAPARGQASQAPDFTESVLEQLEGELGHARLAKGGLEVTTTLDYSLQTEVDELLAGFDEADLVIVDPLNNRILASRGNIHEEHEPGILLNPFIYLSAFARGYSPSSMIWPAAVGPINLRQAFATQASVIGDYLLENPAISAGFGELTRGLGMETSAPESAFDLLSLTQVFEVLSNNGFLASQPSPNTLLFAANSDGSIEADFTQTEWRPILSSELVFLVNDVSAHSAQGETTEFADRPTTLISNAEQTWLVAYSPQRVVSLYVGDETEADSILAAIFDAAHRDLPIKDWETPAGLTSVIVCVPSGQLPDDDCPETRREWFLRGNEPTEYDTLYERIAINKLNGKLATVFTRAEFVQERVYLMVPPEVKAWAEAAEIPLPPEDYDPVPSLVSNETRPAISRPEPFDEVSGVVQILGGLHPNAIGYDIQVGEGLRPTAWIVIAEGRSAGSTGKLAEWDTAGLSGIWAIQLQSWDADGRITRAYSVVTIE